jgi:hypothetical protein
MSYIIPRDELSLSEMKNHRERALQAGIARAAEKLGVNASELCARQFLNVTDAGAALEQWNTAALAVVGTAYSVFQAIAAPTLANNKLAVFYKVGIETAPLPACRLTFRSGAAAGNVIAEFDLEQLVNAQVCEGYFNEPICIDPTQTFAIQVTCRIATGAAARVQFGNYLIEPIGQTIA